MSTLALSLDQLPLQRATALPAPTGVIRGSDIEQHYHPTLSGLIPLLGGYGLKRSVPYLVESSTSLALAMLAGASAAGAWSAIVGMPQLGTQAAAAMGIDLDRLALVPDPGHRWLDVVAILCDALDVVLVRAPGQPRSADVGRISARLRGRGCTLIVLGQSWLGAHQRLTIGRSTWLGMGQNGHGHLAARHALVTASGKGTPHVEHLWLPAPDGTVRRYIGDASASSDRLRLVP